MDERTIGRAAGIVWNHLKESTGTTLSSVKKIRGIKTDEAIAALGWLAREGKIEFHNDKKRILIKLAQNEFAGV